MVSDRISGGAILAGDVKYLGWVAQLFSQEIASYETKKALGFFERIKYIFLENIKIEVTVQ